MVLRGVGFCKDVMTRVTGAQGWEKEKEIASDQGKNVIQWI